MSSASITFQVICAGNSAVLRAIGIPLCEALEADPTGIEIREQELPAVLQIDKRPVAGVSAIAATFGVIAFLGSWAAKKTLDELYASKIRPKIDEVVRSSKAQELRNKPGKKWLFQLGVWYEEERVFILLVLVGNDLKQVMAQELLLPQLHSQALNWLRENSSNAPVHLYIAEDGKANLAPITFDHAAEAQRYLEGLWPVVIPSDGSSA
jgi:hypothetical protein